MAERCRGLSYGQLIVYRSTFIVLLTLNALNLYFTSSRSLLYFLCRQKVPKSLAQTKIVVYSFIMLTTPPYRIPLGTTIGCATCDYLLAMLSICKNKFVSYHVTSLIRLLLVVRVCRSNLGNKRTRFTHSQHRMAHTLRHFCSFSSIETDTHCCSTPCRFCF